MTFPMESSTAGYNAEQPNGTTSGTNFNATHECSTMIENLQFTYIIFLSLSVFLAVGLAFIIRRKNLRLSCCWGRPGFLQPVNFIDEVSRRWAYAACFVILTNDVLFLVVGQDQLIPLTTNNEAWIGMVRVLVNLLAAFAACLVYYPLLACINHRRSIAANVLGILYLIPWITIYSCYFHSCPIRSQEIIRYNNISYVTRIPIYIAFYVVGLSCVLDFIKNINRRRNLRSEAIYEAKSLVDGDETIVSSISHHSEYVAELLRPRKPEQIDETENAIRLTSKKLLKRLKYEKILGFRYSTRLVCCTTTAATSIIWVVVSVAISIDEILNKFAPLCEEVSTDSFSQELGLIFCELLYITRILFHVANASAGLIVLIFMVNTLVTYKRRWHQLLRGDHSWHMYGTKIESPSATLLNGLEYAGFQVAYAVWGWAVLLITLWIVLMFLAFAFIIPLKKGDTNSWFITLLKTLLPTVVMAIVIAVIQRLICRYLFLQDRGSVMALNNRRVYNAASYYFLFLNVIVGFISCLKRILIPLVLGILFLSRLDQPLILKGFETFDPGYVSFVSMLLVDLYHNHPVVKAFVELMLKVREQEQPFTEVDGETVFESEEKRRRSKMIRNRWWKAVTLANNPSLVFEILQRRLKNERNNAEQPNAGNDLRSVELQPFPESHGDQFSFA